MRSIKSTLGANTRVGSEKENQNDENEKFHRKFSLELVSHVVLQALGNWLG